ncbi:MAG: glycosyltransferase involved in cell wall biosynthesis, partial [Saprospiraceae bacterium]
ASEGWKVLLIGRILSNSSELPEYSFQTLRVSCLFVSGPLFYAEILWRFRKALKQFRFARLLCIDIDTLGILNLLDTKKIKVYFDAHEYFTEVPELNNAYIKKAIWTKWGSMAMTKVETAYTVGPELANILGRKYDRRFHVVRNVPERSNIVEIYDENKNLSLVYLGVLNPGRGLEILIDIVLKRKDLLLMIVGDGPLDSDLKTRAGNNSRIQFMGKKKPSELLPILRSSDVGVNLLEGSSLNYYYSLANKFFDYLQAGLPVLCMNFPEYSSITETYNCIYPVENLSNESLNRVLDSIDKESPSYREKKQQCKLAAATFNWEKEGARLLEIFDFK